MTQLRAHGISASLPNGVEGRIRRHPATGGERTYPVGHFATFALPPDPGDFGGGAVDLMSPSDAFVVLLEYGPESADRRLFAGKQLPRALEPRDFSPAQARAGGNRSATQHFFVERGRPFTMYAVVGSHLLRRYSIPVVNAILRGLDIEAAA